MEMVNLVLPHLAIQQEIELVENETAPENVA